MTLVHKSQPVAAPPPRPEGTRRDTACRRPVNEIEPMRAIAHPVERLFLALKAHDAEAVEWAYAPGAVVEHPLLGALRHRQIGAFWRSFLNLTPDFEIAFEIRTLGAVRAEADWSMSYTLHITNRRIAVAGTSRFAIMSQAITHQADALDRRDWSRQALGFKGLVLSYMPGWRGFIEDEMRNAFELAAHDC